MTRKAASIVLLCLLTACAQEDKAHVDVLPRHPDRTDEVSKPTTLSASEQALLLFDEVGKLHRTLRHVANRKETGEASGPIQEGCVDYYETPQDPNFLYAEYDRCQKTLKPTTPGTPSIQYKLEGIEKFKRVSEQVISVRADLTLTISAMTKPAKRIAQYKYVRDIEVILPNKSFGLTEQDFSFTTEHSYTPFANTGKATREKWTLSTLGGRFRRAASATGETNFWMERGLRLKFSYWKPQASDKTTVTPQKYDVIAADAIQFGPALQGCAKVRDGAFAWTLIDELDNRTSGRWTADNDGLKDIDTSSVTRWSTGCGTESFQN